MKNFLIGAVALLASTFSAVAEVGIRYVPLGYQQITGLSTVKSLTVPAAATSAMISVTGQAVRYRDDGTAPTASVGMPITVGQTIQYTGSLTKLQVIEQSASATVDVLYYR